MSKSGVKLLSSQQLRFRQELCASTSLCVFQSSCCHWQQTWWSNMELPSNSPTLLWRKSAGIVPCQRCLKRKKYGTVRGSFLHWRDRSKDRKWKTSIKVAVYEWRVELTIQSNSISDWFRGQNWKKKKRVLVPHNREQVNPLCPRATSTRIMFFDIYLCVWQLMSSW